MDQALDGALLLFRERGYHETSLSELGQAMKLAPGSIYKAFKDKREIFLAALERYTKVRHDALEVVLAKGRTGKEKLEAALFFLGETSYGDEGKVGCLVVGSTADISTFDPEVSFCVSAAAKRMESLFLNLVVLGQADGSLAKTIDAAVTANTLFCFAQGLRVVGKIGRTRSQMTATIHQVLGLF